VAGLFGGPWRRFRAVAGVVSVNTAVIAGSAVGHAAAVELDHSLVVALVSGATIAIVALALLVRSQRIVWKRTVANPPSADDPRPVVSRMTRGGGAAT